MTILYQHSLQAYNTFGIPAKAAAFTKVASVANLQKVLAQKILPPYILGGGSNMLLANDMEALVIKNNILGRTIIEETAEDVLLAIGGGENWHNLVQWCVSRNYGGIENLSLIPGTVGAAPIQNIGAYGVELKDVFHSLEAVSLETGEVSTFDKQACQFAYRDSIFKRELKGKYCITQVVLRLQKTAHQIHLKYGAIKKMLEEKGIQQPTIQDMSEVIIAIRSSKLPDPAVLGNSGSFFKNPEIERSQFEELQEQFPNIVFYDLPSGKVKIPAGWLIEQCGWKGKRVGETGAYAKQALVLVNYGKATGQEIWQLAMNIVESVKNKFGIELSPEVNVLGL